MKKLLLIITIISITITQAQIVNIPDANFKNALINHNPVIDTNGDGEIQISEANAFYGTIDVSNKNISDLTGIEAFSNITNLRCSDNQLTTLNVSNNTNLNDLNCSQNQLTGLNVSNNTSLEFLLCEHNQLTTLDVSNNTNLTFLDFNDNQISNIDVTNNVLLTTLYCNFNSLNNLDVSQNTALENLSCSVNQLTSIDISNNTNLKYFYASSNQFDNLNVSNNPNLIYIYCENNQLTALDISNNPNLRQLRCSNNQINSLEVSNLTYLNDLECGNNQLSNLDVSQNTLLNHLWCNDNQLNTLDVSNNSQLYVLKCNDNSTLIYINLKNGNNDNMWIWGCHFENLPNLQDVCVDALNTPLTDQIVNQTGHSVNFSTDCSSLSLNENNNIDFSVYPIPTENFIEIEADKSINIIEIYNKLGQRIITTTKKQIDISKLTKGIYLVKLIDSNGNIGIKKIIKD